MDALTQNQTFASPAEALEHYGVKGMKWGVRKDAPSSSSTASGSSKVSSGDIQPATEESRRFNAKKAAIGAGILLGVAGAGYVGYQLHQNGAFKGPASKLPESTSNKGKDAAEKVLKEPTDLIYMARGKNQGLTFHRKGDSEDYFAFSEKMGMQNHDNPREFFKKDDDGHILTRFDDPEGRTDHAGRTLGHDIIIPRVMSNGINNVDDVKSKIWPTLKPEYDKFYEATLLPKFMREES